MKKRLYVSLLATLVGTTATIAGCGGDDTAVPLDAGRDVVVAPDGGPMDANGGDATDGGPLEFTTFVKQLILTQTMDNTMPTTTEDKTFVDSKDPKAFPPSFFP